MKIVEAEGWQDKTPPARDTHVGLKKSANPGALESMLQYICFT
jgi:hypothetical protein